MHRAAKHRLASIIVVPIALGAWYVNQQHAMALRAVRAANEAAGSMAGRRAVVVGATSGIGRAIAVRLAAQDFDVTVVGRDAARGQEVLAQMKAGSGRGAHDFVSVDGSLLANAYAFEAGWTATHGRQLDVLVLTQGIATMQGFTPTAEGLDQKLATHYFARMAFVDALLPALRHGTQPRVLSVLSAGVHGVYAHFATDPELRAHYTLKHAADGAGLYNDVAADTLSRDPANAGITFIHAAPGAVATNWGTELPYLVRQLARGALKLVGTSPADCAEFMVAPLLSSAEPLGQTGGFRLVGSTAQVVPATSAHEQAREPVWAHTRVLLDAAKARATGRPPHMADIR